VWVPTPLGTGSAGQYPPFAPSVGTPEDNGFTVQYSSNDLAAQHAAGPLSFTN